MIIVPVILAGGIGERFWPASRRSRPKQLLPLLSEKLMIEETFERALPLCSAGVKPLIVTGTLIAGTIDAELNGRYSYDTIAEPVGKNTAPAVAAAAAFCAQRYGDDAVMVVVSADHSIRTTEQFLDAARYGAAIATQEEALVVFGIRPTRPETGYGYIESGDTYGTSAEGIRSVRVTRFVEKPNREIAEEYLSSGRYFWNSGMFIWRCSTILGQFQKHMPDLFAQAHELRSAGCTVEAITHFYTICKKESIDFGIMERAESVIAVEGIFEWDDIGSWESLERIYAPDATGNTISGSRVVVSDCSGTIVANQSDRHVAVIGAENLLVVSVGDTILVIPREKLGDLKNYLPQLRESFGEELF